jgi:hypothetical protein
MEVVLNVGRPAVAVRREGLVERVVRSRKFDLTR